MGTRIQILPDTVINKIAAGEVVERPASVVKELVENALDAGARSVDIVLRNGGSDLVEVIDDGCGIGSEEGRLALMRHATSKISLLEDLYALRSFGFRGEALPSIASVSRLTLETNDGSVGGGIRLLAEGGEIKLEEPIARQQGTTVRVEHLFANVPARRKFLKSPRTEYRHALKTVVEAALSCLDTGFRLVHDGRESFKLEAGQQLLERARIVFGSKALDRAVIMAAEMEGIGLRGLLGAPESSRRTSSAVHLFVNGRPIGHRGLLYALYTGYGELLKEGRYPFACLFLDIPPDRVDINVHPAKREVRFENESGIKDFVIAGIREALSRELDSRSLNLGGRTGDSKRGSETQERCVGEGDLPWHHRGLFTRLNEEVSSAATDLFLVETESDRGSPALDRGLVDGRSIEEEPMIWQIHEQYLLAPIKGGILVVDQHAAHERILYEEALSQLTGKPAARQQMLFPKVLELSPNQFTLVKEFGPLLERVGFDVRPFGGNSVALQAVPPLLEREGRGEDIFLVLLDDLSETGVRGSGVQEKIAASLACRAAINFGQKLDPEERRSLVDRLFACSQPHVCPHGRPTHFVLSLEELDNRFDR